jgi:4-oxalocrotonate tautomerase
MPIISVTIAEGRTVEKKRRLIRALTDAAVEAFEVNPQQVRVMLNELPLEHYAVAGVTFGEKAEANGDSK